MNEEQAREILKGFEFNPTYLANDDEYMCWEYGDKKACFDGEFTPDQLEAIAWWMKNKGE